MLSHITSYGNIYAFSFEQQADRTLRIYIVSQPSYGSRDASSRATQRLSDGRRWYLPSHGKIYAPYQAEDVAENWAMRTDRYLYTGLPLSVPLHPPAQSAGGGTDPPLPLAVPRRTIGDNGRIRRGGGGGGGGRGSRSDPFGIYARVPKIDWRKGLGGSDG